MEKRMTKKDYLGVLRGLAVEAGNQEAVEFCDKEIERLTNRKASQTKTQKANAGLTGDIVAALTRAGKPVTVSQLLTDMELKAAVEATGANFSNQKVSALVNALAKPEVGVVVKTTEKKVSYFALKDEDAE